MLAGNIPGQTQTIPVAIYFAVEAGDMKQASIWTGNLSYFSDGSHRREFWSDSRRSVAVRARGKESRKQGTQEPLGIRRWENLTPKRPKRTVCRHSKQLPGFLETFFTTA